MFREMRRKKQQLSFEECELILKNATSGVLALSGDDGYPYAVPLSFVYSSGSIFFHCAGTGHKLDAVMRSEKASFCVIARDDVIPEKFTTAYKSVIAFGTARILDSEEETLSAVRLLSDKYSPVSKEEREREIELFKKSLTVIELKIRHMTGKAGKEAM